MVYDSPVEDDVDDPELHVIDKAKEYTQERFNFTMFFVGGLVLILVGFFRMILFTELSWLNGIFVLAGFAISLGSQHWLKSKQASGDDIKLIKKRKEAQYELQAADFGFTDQIHVNKEREKYEEKLEAEQIEPDVKHAEEEVDANSEASFEPESKGIQ